MSVTTARPIVEQIAVVLYERLRLLTSGYMPEVPIKEVVRPKRIEDLTPRHLQIVLAQADSERIPEIDIPGNPPGIGKRQRFNVHCHIMPSEKDPTPFDEYANTMYGAVCRVITDAGGTWHTMGGFAIDTEIDEAQPIAADGGVDGITIPVFVKYRVSELDPWKARV